MSWLTTVRVNVTSLQVAKWVPNLGALAKLVVVLAIIAAAVKTALGGQGLANELNFSTMLPSVDGGLAFLPVIVYDFSGFELLIGVGATLLIGEILIRGRQAASQHPIATSVAA